MRIRVVYSHTGRRTFGHVSAYRVTPHVSANEDHLAESTRAMRKLWLSVSSVLLLTSQISEAATPLLELSASPDISIELTGLLIDDGSLAVADFSGGGILSEITGLPPSADLTGFAALGNGDFLLAFQNAVELPGPLIARSGDLVRLSGNTYSIEFGAAAAGLPAGTLIDAVTEAAGGLLLSFDTTIEFAGVIAHDEDLVFWNGATLALDIDISSHGIAQGLDLDAAHWVEANGRLLVSFDGAGTAGGVFFTDEDILELDPLGSTWSLAYDGSVAHPGWAPADIDALSVISDADGDGLSDDEEAALGTNPLNPDSDGDLLSDFVETNTGIFIGPEDTGTDPLDDDSDGDGFGDGIEVASGSDPNDENSIPAQVPALDWLGMWILTLLLAAAGGLSALRHTWRSR